MVMTAQARALTNYRKRLSKRGLARFEVLGLDSDRELVRAFARRWLRTTQRPRRFEPPCEPKSRPMPSEGRILAMLRSWPLAIWI